MPNTIQSSLLYRGSSMNHTFKFSDALQIAPYNGRRVRPGDVIVFISPKNGDKVVHRVVLADGKRIMTKGDNNDKVDPWLLKPDDIVGRVICTQSKDGKRRVYGGLGGRAFVSFLRAKRKTDAVISLLFGPLYRRLAKRGIFKGLMPCQKRLRMLILNRPAGEEFQILLDGRLIARRLPKDNEWRIRRPFRLFVEAYLKN